jgi:hypothetical protein
MYSKYSSSLAFAFLCVLSICISRPLYGAPANDPCSLLAQSQVSTALGTSVEAAQHIASKLCQWSAPNQPNSMNGKKVTLTISEERAFGYAKTPIVSTVKTLPASGICDDAVYTVSPGVTPGLGTSLYVKKGSSYIVLHVYGFPDQSTAMGMEKTLALQACSNL